MRVDRFLKCKLDRLLTMSNGHIIPRRIINSIENIPITINAGVSKYVVKKYEKRLASNALTHSEMISIIFIDTCN